MRVLKGYDFNNDPSTIKQEALINSIIEGRLVPRDLSALDTTGAITSTTFIYVDDNGKATKLALTDITNGVIAVVDELPTTANDGQITILQTAPGKYEFYKYADEAWSALHLASDADIVTYDAEGSSLESTTVQAAIDELSDKIDSIQGGSVYSINEQAGDVVITGTEGKLAVTAANKEINLDASTLALDADLQAENARAEEAEAAAEAAAKAYAKEYTDTEVATLSDDVYHKADIKNIALTGEANDVYVEEIPGISSTNLQIVLGLLNQKAATGGVALNLFKMDTPRAGFIATYELSVDSGSESYAAGYVDIPKDFTLKTAELSRCLITDVPIEGLQVDDPYLTLTTGTVDGDPGESIYVNLASLVDLYEPVPNAEKIQISITSDSEGRLRLVGASVVPGSIARTDLTTDVQTTLEQVVTNATAIAGLADTKVDKVDGSSLMTTAEHEKLEGIAAGAEVNVQADWAETDTAADSFIQNKPALAAVALSGDYDDLSGTPLAGDGIAYTYDSEGNLTITNTNLSAEWGNIEGDITAQADLQNALSTKVDKSPTAGLMTNAEKTKLADIAAGAQVNVIETVDGHFSIDNRQLQLNNIEASKVIGLTDALATKVDKVTDRSLVADTEIAKLATVSANAKNVQHSLVNGNIIIDGVEDNVYTAPAGTVVDAGYVHIDVTDTSVTDGTHTFTKYDDTALASRVTANEAALESLDSSKQGNLTSDQLAAANSTITSQKVTQYTTHVNNEAIHVTAAQKNAWTAKQDAITSTSKLSTDLVDGLATVATSGAYGDLSGRPTIPVVNNGSLSITVNAGTPTTGSKATFSANQSENATATITVPTATSHLTNDSNFATTTQVSNAVAGIETKLNRDVLTDVAFSIQGQAASLTVTKDKYNLSTGTATQTQVSAVTIADADNAGLMSSHDVLTLADLQSRVASLEGANTRLLYETSASPSASDINTFVTNLGYEAPFQGISVVVSQTQHIWRYYANTSAWRDDGVDSVSNFTNTSPGLILGSTNDGQIYAETSGTGSVIGWDSVKARITTLENNSATTADLSAVADDVAALQTSKQNTLVSGTSIKTIEGTSLLGSGNIDLTASMVGLGNVDNTADADKPISTATQTALNGKQNTLVGSGSGQNIKTITVGSGNAQTLLGSGTVSVGSVSSVTINVPENGPLGISASGAITGTGTRTISHNTAKKSGTEVTPGDYGDTAAQTPSYGGTFKVPSLTVDIYGHVTAVGEHTVKIPASDNTNTTYTFEGATNSFKVTPSGGTAQTVTVTPSISNNITGTGTRTANYIPIFSAQNTITNSTVAFNTSSGSTSKYLTEKGTWGTITTATTSAAGLMSAADKTKMDNTVTASNGVKINAISAPSTSGGSTYTAGSSGQVLKSNGTNIYWAADNNTTYTAAAGGGLALSGTSFSQTKASKTLTIADWRGTAFPYTQTLNNIAGVYAASSPVIDVDMSGATTAEAVDNLNEAWSKIYRAESAGTTASNGSITFYATEKPTVAIPLIIKGY